MPNRQNEAIWALRKSLIFLVFIPGDGGGARIRTGRLLRNSRHLAPISDAYPMPNAAGTHPKPHALSLIFSASIEAENLKDQPRAAR